MADSSADVEAFRAEARAWLEENFPKSLCDQGGGFTEGMMSGAVKPEGDAEIWRQRMGAKGWGTPTWPSAYGGGGLTPAQANVLQEEMARIGASNPVMSMGVFMFGPTLLEYGTEDQKQRHIPPIVRGELRWCQGYSEPGAGSDLASLQTWCEDAGDHWVVNGQKIWTSGANHADWCFCLVRTDRTKKHEGISFVMINMRQPGVETRPIKLIAGSSPFCETFFTDARVEKDDMIGPPGGGWTIGKRLLQFERSGPGPGRGAAPRQAPLWELAKTYVGEDAQGRIADLDLRTRLTLHAMDAKAYALTQARAAAETRETHNPSVTTSMMRSAGVKIGQARDELMIEILGCRGLGWEAGEGLTYEERRTTRSWLANKTSSIYGGSWEIQQNIIAKRILGLPDTTLSA